MKPNYCTICEEQFNSTASYTAHMQSHQISEQLSSEVVDFIPEVEINPDTGQPKPRPFKQKPYNPLTEYGG